MGSMQPFAAVSLGGEFGQNWEYFLGTISWITVKLSSSMTLDCHSVLWKKLASVSPIRKENLRIEDVGRAYIADDRDGGGLGFTSFRLFLGHISSLNVIQLALSCGPRTTGAPMISRKLL